MTFEVRTFEARTASWWYRVRDQIEFNPPYQRRGQVWDRPRQSFLIDSIVNDFDIPKLYLADFTYFTSHLNTSNARFAVIDGKQRLNAIFGFMDDQVPLAPDFVLRENAEIELGGLSYSEIRRTAPEVAAKVENFNLPVMSVITDDEQAVHELFVRLNSGKPLTPAERRNAMTGIVPGLVREIVSTPLFRSCIAFPNRGASHEQAAAKLILLEVSSGPVDLKRAQLDDLYRRGQDEMSARQISAAATDVLETAGLMAEAFTEKDPLLRTQGQLPVYYLTFRRGAVPSDIRQRILRFNTLRAQVRTLLGGSSIDVPASSETISLAARYNELVRNPNDARSVYQMSEILQWFIDTSPE